MRRKMQKGRQRGFVALLAVSLFGMAATGAGAEGPLVYLPFDGAVDAVTSLKGVKTLVQGKQIYAPGTAGQGFLIQRHAYDQVTCLSIPKFISFPVAEGTVMFWFRPGWDKDHSKEQTIWQFTGTEERGGEKTRLLYCLKRLAGGQLNLSLIIGKQKQITIKVPWNKDKWIHLAFTWNAGTQDFRLYRDGKLLRAGPNSASRQWQAPEKVVSGAV